MWDLPGPGLEPVFPALAGGFLTTVPPGKPYFYLYIFRLLLFFFFPSLLPLRTPLWPVSSLSTSFRYLDKMFSSEAELTLVLACISTIYYEAIMIPCHEMRWEKLFDPWRLNNGGTGFHQQGQQQSVRGDHKQPDFNSVQRAALNIKKTEIRSWLAIESAQHCGVQQSDTDYHHLRLVNFILSRQLLPWYLSY